MKWALSLLVLSFIISSILLHPRVRLKVGTFLGLEKRALLSQLSLEKDGQSYKILKIQAPQKILVEVYRVDLKNSIYEATDKKILPWAKDAYYLLGQTKSNLFAKDLDEDQTPEILLPSRHRNMSSRLNIYSLDFKTGQLIERTPEPL